MSIRCSLVHTQLFARGITMPTSNIYLAIIFGNERLLSSIVVKHINWLVVWNICYFSILGITPTVTHSIIFQRSRSFFRGVGQPPTRNSPFIYCFFLNKPLGMVSFSGCIASLCIPGRDDEDCVICCKKPDRSNELVEVVAVGCYILLLIYQFL